LPLGSEECHCVLNTPQYEARSGSCSQDEVILEEGMDMNQLPHLEKGDEDQISNKSINQTDETKVYQKRNKSVDIDNTSLDDQEDTRSVGTQESGSSHKIDKATTTTTLRNDWSHFQEE
jgi:hypothetical protein